MFGDDHNDSAGHGHGQVVLTVMQIVEDLGGEIRAWKNDFSTTRRAPLTHLVTDKIHRYHHQHDHPPSPSDSDSTSRTVKFLGGLCLCKHVVRPDWITASHKAGYFVGKFSPASPSLLADIVFIADEKDFAVHDNESESLYCMWQW